MKELITYPRGHCQTSRRKWWSRFFAADETPACRDWKDSVFNFGDGGIMLLPHRPMSIRFIINSHFGKILSDPQAKILKEFNMVNVDQAWTTGNFDLLSAGS